MLRGGRVVLATFVAMALAVAATTTHRQDLTTTPAAKAPPVTLAAGTSGSTSLGSSGTSATTSVGIGLTTLTVLKVHKVSDNWDVKVSLGSASGFGVLESATVALVGGSAQNQVVILLGTVTQSSGSTVALTGSDLTITVAGTVAVTGTLALNVVLVPQGGTAPVMTYSYTLTLT